MRKLFSFLLSVIFALTSASAAWAQNTPGDAAPPASPAPSSTDVNSKIDSLQEQVDALESQLNRLKADQEKADKAAAPVTIKKGNSLTFQSGASKDSVQLYGNFDVSVDDVTKGLGQFYSTNPALAPCGASCTPVGNMGYLLDLSTNLSYIGVRGVHVVNPTINLVYQLETQIDITANPGVSETNSSSSDIVKSGLFSRNSYVGIADKYLGAIKIGKTDAPYKTSTARMNPFSGEIGDYQVIMGNTGGDNRVEFGTRVPHAIWYESPKLYGLTLNALVSPGQNRAYDDSLVPAGEPDCAGTDTPGSGALQPYCNDGSFGTLYSYSLAYEQSKFYLVGAFELHKKVNRTSDINGLPGLTNFDPNDVGDEMASKAGVQYAFSPRTTASAIYEYMERDIPNYLEVQNERTRTGFWLALTQFIGDKDNINFGWARANPTPGDPGQHNDPFGALPDNMANMYTIAYKRAIDSHLSWYVDGAYTANHAQAHYDLGAGGRGITTDCHDASPLAAYDPTNPGVEYGNGPLCYTGGQIRGYSTGLTFKF